MRLICRPERAMLKIAKRNSEYDYHTTSLDKGTDSTCGNYYADKYTLTLIHLL